MKNLLLTTLIVSISFIAGCQPSNGKDTGTKKNDRSSRSSKDLQSKDFSANYMQGTTVVYFAKAICPACAKQDPLWQEAVGKLPSGVNSTKVYSYAINTREYGVRELPTIIIYRDGHEKKRFVGVTSARKIISAAR